MPASACWLRRPRVNTAQVSMKVFALGSLILSFFIKCKATTLQCYLKAEALVQSTLAMTIFPLNPSNGPRIVLDTGRIKKGEAAYCIFCFFCKYIAIQDSETCIHL